MQKRSKHMQPTAHQSQKQKLMQTEKPKLNYPHFTSTRNDRKINTGEKIVLILW